MGLPNVDTFDPADIKLAAFDAKSVKFSTCDGGVIRLQTPKHTVCFDPDPKQHAGETFVINLSLSTDPVSTEKNIARIDKFKKIIADLESRIIELLPSQHASKEFYSSLWQGSNAAYGPVFKASMFPGGSRPCAVFDKTKTPVGISEVKRGQVVATAIRLDKVWANDKKIGINWTIEQLKICEDSGESGTGGFSIRDD